MNCHRQPTIRVRRAITQASNEMIESSLLKTRIRLLQCYDWKPTALCVSQNGSFQSPCSLWEQEFRSSTDIRQPSTVNRVLVSCSGVIGNSLLLVCHTERRPQSPCSMWEQELNRYPLITPKHTVFCYTGGRGGGGEVRARRKPSVANPWCSLSKVSKYFVQMFNFLSEKIYK